jgi:glycosyltransferase involved in cell wall biosynthesis
VYRVAYLVSHPIQYQAPMLRFLANQADLQLEVWFVSDFSVRSYVDTGFGTSVAWDSDLTSGYRFEVLPGQGNDGQPSFFRPFSRSLIRRINLSRIDALWLHGWASNVHLRATAIARARGIPVLVRSESRSAIQPGTAGMRTLSRAAKPLLLRQFDGYLAIGSLNRDWYLENGVSPERIFSMPYTVDNDFFRDAAAKAAPRREQLRRELGLEPGRPVVLFVSKMQRRKRAMDLLRAWSLLPAASRPHLLFGGDGEERPDLEDLVRREGWEGVRFAGFRNQNELPALYELCDVFVLPSEHEPWGLVVNEVMNAARPVIVTDGVGCAADLVEEGVTGHVVPVGDISALARRIDELAGDGERASAMGLAAQKLIEGRSFVQDADGLRSALETVTRRRMTA